MSVTNASHRRTSLLVNLKRSRSAPGLVEASCRLPFLVPTRPVGRGAHRLSSIKETDVNTISPLNRPQSTSSYDTYPKQQSRQQFSASSNSLLVAAPLASSISVTSSLNSSRQATINHSVSWSTTTDTTRAASSHVARTISLLNSDIRTGPKRAVSNEIEP